MSAFGIEHEALVTPEEEVQPTVGVALLILGFDSSQPKQDGLRVWTVMERHSKPETDKRSGQLSIPAETGKIGEGPEKTALAALAEFSDDDAIIDRLHVAGYRHQALDVRGKKADLAVMIYDGDLTTPHAPIDPEEIQPYGWVDPNFIRRMNGQVRPLAHDALSVVGNEEMERLIEVYTDPSARLPLRSFVGEDFSLGEFSRVRDLIQDNPLS